MKNSKGFTLIELIAVVAIIAILAAVILPNVFGQIRKARVSRNLSEADDLRNASLQFFADAGTWPSQAAGTLNGSIARLLTNPVPIITTWRGPYLDKAPRIGLGALYNSQYAGCMFLNSVTPASNGDGLGATIERNGNGVLPDRYVYLGHVTAREANDTDITVDGTAGIATGAVISEPPAGAALCGAAAYTGTGDWTVDSGDATEPVLIIINEGT